MIYSPTPHPKCTSEVILEPIFGGTGTTTAETMVQPSDCMNPGNADAPCLSFPPALSTGTQTLQDTHPSPLLKGCISACLCWGFPSRPGSRKTGSRMAGSFPLGCLQGEGLKQASMHGGKAWTERSPPLRSNCREGVKRSPSPNPLCRALHSSAQTACWAKAFFAHCFHARSCPASWIW